MNRYSVLLLTALALPVSGLAQTAGKWTPDWQVLNRHKAPDWILDAKIGIQYVGEPMNLDDYQNWHWGRSAERYRELGSPAPEANAQELLKQFALVGKLPYVWVNEPVKDPDAVLAQYKELGARFVVSMLSAAYPGTEGLLMEQAEVDAARRQGLKVGVHYNLLHREKLPAIGDPGYVPWFHKRLAAEVEKVESDFVFFDGCQASSSYFRSAEFLAWYYNWADRKGKQVWVNDDLGTDKQETGEFGDLVDHESFTVDGISPKPWINWDILRNQWTCWINEFGVHKMTGKKWAWQYKPVPDLMLIMLDTISKGGVWLVQMDNTKQSWENMREIGAWLKVNGEAIYGTRPYGTPAARMVRLPVKSTMPKGANTWWWQFEESVKVARGTGPLYYTRKGGTLYAIHYGWPETSISIPGVRPKPGAKIRMVGIDRDLTWRQDGGRLVIDPPAGTPPCKYAYSFRIPIE